jgi:glycerol dehydrogenase-like iron-containing ADH family enzyme
MALIMAGCSACTRVRGSLIGLPNVAHLHFGGECTSTEFESVAQAICAGGHAAAVGYGDGEVIGTAPTIASTDEPTSETAVVYHAEGTFNHYLRSRNSAAFPGDTSVSVSVPDRKPCDSAGLKTMIGWVFLEAFSSSQASAPSSFF